MNPGPGKKQEYIEPYDEDFKIKMEWPDANPAVDDFKVEGWPHEKPAVLKQEEEDVKKFSLKIDRKPTRTTKPKRTTKFSQEEIAKLEKVRNKIDGQKRSMVKMYEEPPINIEASFAARVESYRGGGQGRKKRSPSPDEQDRLRYRLLMRKTRDSKSGSSSRSSKMRPKSIQIGSARRQRPDRLYNCESEDHRPEFHEYCEDW